MKQQTPESSQNRSTPRYNRARALVLGSLLAASVLGGLLHSTARRGGDAHNSGPAIAAVEPNHRINAGELPPTISTAEVSDNYNLAAPVKAPDGHSLLAVGTANKGGGPGPKDTELFMSVDNGKDWRPVASGATDAVWAPESYVVNGQDTAFAALYNNADGPGTPNLQSDANAPGYTDVSTYVGLFEVNANGTTAEIAAAPCLDTSLQPIALPLPAPNNEVTPYQWGNPVRNREGQLVGKFSVYQIIGGENPDGSTWYGGMLDNSVTGPVQG